MISNEELTAAYAQMVEDRVQAGWQPYLLSFMFKHTGGSPQRVQEIMRQEVERVYATALTRIVRDPRSASHDQLPIMIGAPDFPVPKHDRTDKQWVLPNDGQHVHTVVLIPPVSRLRVPLHDYIEDEQAALVRRPLFRIDARPITHDVAYVMEYVLKSLKRGRIGADDVIVLPRPASEMTRDGITPWTRRRLAEASGAQVRF